MQALFITHFANGTRLPPAKVYETEKLPPAAPQVDVEGGDFDDGPGSTPQVQQPWMFSGPLVEQPSRVPISV